MLLKQWFILLQTPVSNISHTKCTFSFPSQEKQTNNSLLKMRKKLNGTSLKCCCTQHIAKALLSFLFP